MQRDGAASRRGAMVQVWNTTRQGDRLRHCESKTLVRQWQAICGSAKTASRTKPLALKQARSGLNYSVLSTMVGLVAAHVRAIPRAQLTRGVLTSDDGPNGYMGHKNLET